MDAAVNGDGSIHGIMDPLLAIIDAETLISSNHQPAIMLPGSCYSKNGHE